MQRLFLVPFASRSFIGSWHQQFNTCITILRDFPRNIALYRIITLWITSLHKVHENRIRHFKKSNKIRSKTFQGKKSSIVIPHANCCLILFGISDDGFMNVNALSTLLVNKTSRITEQTLKLFQKFTVLFIGNAIILNEFFHNF
jgi:hypothetical protein